jgi:hypothetical protein
MEIMERILLLIREIKGSRSDKREVSGWSGDSKETFGKKSIG